MARSLVLRLRRSLRGGGSCPGAGRDSVQPRQTDAVDQIAAREADGCKAEGRGLLESESFMSMNRMRNRVSGSPLAASQLRQTDEVDQFLGLSSRLHPTLLSPGPPRAGRPITRRPSMVTTRSRYHHAHRECPSFSGSRWVINNWAQTISTLTRHPACRPGLRAASGRSAIEHCHSDN